MVLIVLYIFITVLYYLSVSIDLLWWILMWVLPWRLMYWECFLDQSGYLQPNSGSKTKIKVVIIFKSYLIKVWCNQSNFNYKYNKWKKISSDINVIIITPHLNPTTQSLLPPPLKPQLYTSPKNLHTDILWVRLWTLSVMVGYFCVNGKIF